MKDVTGNNYKKVGILNERTMPLNAVYYNG